MMYLSEIVLLIALVILLCWAVTPLVLEAIHDYDEAHASVLKQAADHPSTIDKDHVTRNPYMVAYHEALAKQDKEGMMNALIQCKGHCSGANSWCLTEMFCPECPISGELPVQSGRYGMEE